MSRTGLILGRILLLILINPALFHTQTFGVTYYNADNQDTTKSDQVLFSGRMWRNLYSRVVGDQFLFTPEFMQSTVFIDGKKFCGVPLKYDIFKDEVISRNTHGLFIQLNKEHVDSFYLDYNGQVYRFVNLAATAEPSGYARLLYSGESKFLIKYKKNIELLAVEGKKDLFYQVMRLYLLNEGIAHQFNGRMELFRLFEDHRNDVRDYMKKNKIKISRKDPESYIPLIKQFDRLE